MASSRMWGAVVGPESELVFGVMQGVDAVPPAIAVGEAVAPVVGQIEDGEVENEGNPQAQRQEMGEERATRAVGCCERAGIR